MAKEFIKSWKQGSHAVAMYQVEGKNYVIHSTTIPYPIYQSDETSANYTFTYQKDLIELRGLTNHD